VVSLNEKYGIKDRIIFTIGNGGLVKASLHLASGTSAEVYLHGAHVTSFKVETGKDVLFVSKKAIFSPSKAIRGGIPVIFPQFGPGKLPQHGFARDHFWTIVGTGVVDSHSTWITLELKDSELTRKTWPYAFTLSLTTTITYNDTNKSHLQQKMVVINDSETDKFEFTAALHTYFSISNIHTTSVSPAKGLWYFDKTTNQRVQQEENLITFKKETDNMFYAAPNQLLIEDTSNGYKVKLEKENFNDAVVWNIWGEKIKTISDFSPEEWEHYVCVEAGVIEKPVLLSPKQVWEGSQHFGL